MLVPKCYGDPAVRKTRGARKFRHIRFQNKGTVNLSIEMSKYTITRYFRSIHVTRIGVSQLVIQNCGSEMDHNTVFVCFSMRA